jgi:hypothetical protein
MDVSELESALAGLDTRLVPSVAETFRSLSATHFADMTALTRTAKIFESVMTPNSVAPQIAENLKRIDTRLMSSYAEAVRVIPRPTFTFAKTLEDTNSLAVVSRVVESMSALAFPPTVAGAVADTLKGLPRISAAHLAPRLEVRAEQAFALAEVEEVAAIIDESVGLLDHLTPAQKKTLALEVAAVIATYLVALTLAASHARNTATVGVLLAFITAWVRVWWRLAGKLD